MIRQILASIREKVMLYDEQKYLVKASSKVDTDFYEEIIPSQFCLVVSENETPSYNTLHQPLIEEPRATQMTVKNLGIWTDIKSPRLTRQKYSSQIETN